MPSACHLSRLVSRWTRPLAVHKQPDMRIVYAVTRLGKTMQHGRCTTWTGGTLRFTTLHFCNVTHDTLASISQ